MRKFLLFLIPIIVLFSAGCINGNSYSDKKNATTGGSKDSTVHERKDSMGRVVERWGNYHTDDRNTNFREFYYYDNESNLVKEITYFFEDDNPDCIIMDTAAYDEMQYFYKKGNKTVLEKTFIYLSEYDERGRFIKRKLTGIYDDIKKEYIYRDDS